MLELNQIYNGDVLNLYEKVPDNVIDLIITSPPYNLDIDYDTCIDDKSQEEYFEWCEKWISESYRTLKPDGRIAINVPNEVNMKNRGGRMFMISEYWQMMKKIGFKFYGIVDLEELSPHRPKNTAWGSWMSPSAPYIYNPKESVILAYKETYVKKIKGEPEWSYKDVEVTNEEGVVKKKRIYEDADKKEFMELVFGCWKYMADTKSLTKATFSLDIPLKAIKILSYKDELVLDPFSGSGTTCLAAKMSGRKYLGFELSSNYTEISKQRIENYTPEVKLNLTENTN